MTNNRDSARNIIWFNLAYTQNVKTNIRKTFLKIIKKCFTYTKTTATNNINRACSMIRFNPSCSQNVKNNIGKTFLKLIKKHFPRDDRLYKIFNRNTPKLSCSCMSNMSSVIKQHNHKVLSTKCRSIMQSQEQRQMST